MAEQEKGGSVFLCHNSKTCWKKFNIVTNTTSLLRLNCSSHLFQPCCALVEWPWLPQRGCISSQSSVLFLVKHMALQKQFQAHSILALGLVPQTYGGEWVGGGPVLTGCLLRARDWNCLQSYFILLTAIVTPGCQMEKSGGFIKVKVTCSATCVCQQWAQFEV